MSENRKVPREAHGWLMLGAEGFCYDASASFARLLKQPKSSILALNWTLLVYADDRDVVRRVVDVLQRQEIPEPVRMRWLNRCNDPIWLEVRFLKRRDRRARCGGDRIIANVRRIPPEAVA